MNDRAQFDESEESLEPQPPAVVRPRGAGTPLSPGVSRHDQPTSAEENGQGLASSQPVRATREESAEASEFPSMQRAAGILRSALPLLQRLLPLLDGNFATVVGSLLSARANAQAARSSGKVDLGPIEDGLAELRSQQHSLRLELTEQNLSLKTVEDQLQMVREVSSRNMLEQQEAIEDLRALAKRVMVIAVTALLLAAAGLAATVALFLRMRKMLP